MLPSLYLLMFASPILSPYHLPYPSPPTFCLFFYPLSFFSFFIFVPYILLNLSSPLLSPFLSNFPTPSTPTRSTISNIYLKARILGPRIFPLSTQSPYHDFADVQWTGPVVLCLVNQSHKTILVPWRRSNTAGICPKKNQSLLVFKNKIKPKLRFFLILLPQKTYVWFTRPNSRYSSDTLVSRNQDFLLVIVSSHGETLFQHPWHFRLNSRCQLLLRFLSASTVWRDRRSKCFGYDFSAENQVQSFCEMFRQFIVSLSMKRCESYEHSTAYFDVL